MGLIFLIEKNIKCCAIIKKKKTKTLEPIYTSHGIPSNGPKTTDSLLPESEFKTEGILISGEV